MQCRILPFSFVTFIYLLVLSLPTCCLFLRYCERIGFLVDNTYLAIWNLRQKRERAPEALFTFSYVRGSTVVLIPKRSLAPYVVFPRSRPGSPYSLCMPLSSWSIIVTPFLSVRVIARCSDSNRCALQAPWPRRRRHPHPPPPLTSFANHYHNRRRDNTLGQCHSDIG
ncbi:hypothetical protein BDQ12DRAFT_378200 [Crucibulum laeve]|uniref:Uncharacterized protein n=1 Tax=Crucibulum laeve TaxID=68775 RepID=A0A5C3LLV1_9AGAR|nr:hypothetical protein BDQ12DRAFT_378200 [Crucibulum laeve]